MIGRRTRLARRAGFTLWEVVLTLAIASVLLLVLGFAIDLHLRVLDAGRGDVEQAQLARTILRRLADDLRGAVRYEEIDTEGLLGNTGAGDVGDALGQGGDEGDGEDAEDEEDANTPSGGDDEDAAEEEAALPSTREPQPMPGVYGGREWLQVDVSRLPRLDEFQFGADGLSGPVATDVKTVVWFLRAGPAQPEDAWGAALPGVGGLVRSQMDRAAALWAVDQGGTLALDTDEPPLSPEVLAVEFRYYDGREWQVEWDTEELGGLPVAVRVAIALPSYELGRRSAAGGQEAADGAQWYSLIVRLPAAEPLPEDPQGAADEEPEEDAPEEADEQGPDPGNDAGDMP
jgi:prepilin-type N-terminal cleavage/methylation domain-containing protein